jgi:hypothetical protein
MDDKVKIVFDKEYKIRALDPSKFEKGEALEKECSKFVEKISSFNEKVNTLVDILDLHASRSVVGSGLYLHRGIESRIRGRVRVIV